MLTLVANGFVTGEVKAEDTEYGKRAVVSIRSKTTNGKQTHYINATFYGKKIDVVTKFMQDGRQVTIVGSVKSIKSQKKKDGTEYASIYMDATDFTLPEKGSDQGYSKNSKEESLDDVPF